MGAFRAGSTANYGNVSIGTSAAVIKAATVSRKSLVVQNLHATQKLYVGKDTSITTSNTVQVGPGQSISFDDFIGPIYGIADGASTDVRYLEIV